MDLLEELIGFIEAMLPTRRFPYPVVPPKFVFEMAGLKPTPNNQEQEEDGRKEGPSNHAGLLGEEQEETDGYGIQREYGERGSYTLIGMISGTAYAIGSAWRRSMEKTQQIIEETFSQMVRILGFPSRFLEEANKAYKRFE